MSPSNSDNYPNVTGADPGRDLFDPGTHMVIWNPDAAQEVKDAGGNILGVQSAALGLLHEIVHSIDPASIAHLYDAIPAYGNATEYTAVQYESIVAANLGEVVRENRRGNDIVAENPSTHTMPTEDGGLIWTQTNEYGVAEYGSYYSSPGQTPSGYVPQFGSTVGNEPALWNSNNQGWPDDIAARNGEPGDALPSFGSIPDIWGGDGRSSGSDPGYSYPGTTGDYAGDDGYYGGGGGYYGGGGGCVAITSFLPDGRTAGQVEVGDAMELGDADTMEAGTGIVGYSQLKAASGYRITTDSGAALVCSDTAPIPVRDRGLLTPDELLGEQVAVRWDEHGQSFATWETVTEVEAVGMIQVQHITVGDKCFWAGEKKGAYILHHNMKQAVSGEYGSDWQFAGLWLV